jgi:hypothetical protein
VPVRESEQDFIHNRLAFTLGFGEPRQNDECHLEHIITDFGVPVVPHGQVLHYLRAVLPKIKVKVHKTDGVEFGNAEVKTFALLGDIAYSHAEVIESASYEMLLPINLNFHNEPCAFGILAIDIEYSVPVEPCSSELLTIYYAYLFDGAFEFFRKESVEEEQKEFRALLVGECSFECEVQSKRSELRMFEASIASRGFGHNNPRGKNSCNKTAPIREYRKTSEPRFARMKGFPGYVEIMLDNPINPLIGVIGVQTINNSLSSPTIGENR